MISGKTMRAAVIAGPRALAIQRVAIPSPRERQVRVRLDGCGVCASNVPTWTGMPWTQYPTEPGALGHEGWGVIDGVGDEVDGLDLGVRVAAVSYHAYAEYDIAPAQAVVKLPPALNEVAFP